MKILLIFFAGIVFAGFLSSFLTPFLGIPITIGVGRLIIYLFKPYID